MAPRNSPNLGGGSSGSNLSATKLPLPTFLKMLTSSGMTMPNAMSAAKSVYPRHGSPAQLAELTPVKLIELKVSDQEQRRLILAAVKKAGYIKPRALPPPKRKAEESAEDEGAINPEPSASSGPSSSPSKIPPPIARKSPAKRRKKDSSPDANEPNAVDPEFHEIMDEETLRTKHTLVNRAPAMTAWATVVAERMGFQREEALSIASVYTELNATSKGISIGVFDESRNRDHVAGSSQPFVDLMGRKIPVLEREEDGQWRGIVKGAPVEPAAPFGYIHRGFRQTTPAVLGAMRLLAQSFGPSELNEKGYSLYCDFRPASEGWGKKGEMRMDAILALRKANVLGGSSSAQSEPAVPAIEDDREEVPGQREKESGRP